MENTRLGNKYIVYDFKDESKLIQKKGFRLEHYYFIQRGGAYEFEFQEGWFAGSHWDGGTLNTELPQEWFELTWEQFLDNFIEKYPPKSYFITRTELECNLALRKFLGFK